jgi:uncharacterized damage-inducible protein DinB
MTYYGGKELAAAFRQVRENTIRIAEDIPENKYDFQATPETRSVAKTLGHIAQSTGWQTTIHGNKIDDLKTVNFPELVARAVAEEAKPRSKAEIIAMLKAEGETFAAYLEGLEEPFLAEQVKQPAGIQPPTKSRFEMLLSAKEHEMHHRAQLMVLQRMIGIVPHITRRMQERMQERMAQAQR